MRSTTLARILLTVVLLGGAISSFFLDWRSNHLLNPAWPPHARFHGGLLLFFLAGVSATCTWLLWRKSAEPDVAFKVAALVSASFWTPFFYVTTLLPEANLWAGPPGALPQLAGLQFYPNVFTAGLCLMLTGISYWLSIKANSR
jgi:Family of unknown function (DUF6640)